MYEGGKRKKATEAGGGGEGDPVTLGPKESAGKKLKRKRKGSNTNNKEFKTSMAL